MPTDHTPQPDPRPEPVTARSACRRLAILRQSFALRLVPLILAALLLAQAAHLVFQPDVHDELRHADLLFKTGQYHAALRSLTALSAQPATPEVLVRLGIVRTVRGEYDLAERALRHALALGMRGEDRDLASLYLGQVLIRRGQAQPAMRLWAQPAADSRLDGPRRVLRAEWALRQGDYAAAEVDYRAALSPTLPTDWQPVVRYRLALLRAASNSNAALIELESADQAPSLLPTHAPPDPLLSPLLPAVQRDVERLLVVLQSGESERPQLLGQLYLELNLFALAEAQFAQVAPDSANALAAAAYAAYTRWRSGDTRGGLARLKQLVARHPEEPRARTLLALAYLSQENTAAARAQIDSIATMAPTDPNTHLAWANWYVAQRDYVSASTEYQRALKQAPLAQRGTYALLVARFHLDTTYELCLYGRPAAEVAVQTLREEAEAWTTLAASRYYCGDLAGAVDAARRAQSYGSGADAAFYLGTALAALGEQEAARSALVQAADLAPASVWRERAEARLAQIR